MAVRIARFLPVVRMVIILLSGRPTRCGYFLFPLAQRHGEGWDRLVRLRTSLRAAAAREGNLPPREAGPRPRRPALLAQNGRGVGGGLLLVRGHPHRSSRWSTEGGSLTDRWLASQTFGHHALRKA
jgi:hypothetical protein